jgi:hypothetical protein
MSDKCIVNLPPIRIGEDLGRALEYMAAVDRRSLSDYVRVVLERHVFGHAEIFGDAPHAGQNNRASQRDDVLSRGGLRWPHQDTVGE